MGDLCACVACTALCGVCCTAAAEEERREREAAAYRAAASHPYGKKHNTNPLIKPVEIKIANDNTKKKEYYSSAV